VWIGVVPFGPNGVALNSSYQSRESPQYMSDLGNAVANFARLVPDGLLVFFPSYHVLDKCTSHWKSDVSNGAHACPVYCLSRRGSCDGASLSARVACE